ncbi:MAG TPA: hypothetical protein VKU41_30630 [Polyangiaceae bacterium]|nr:hypothetical protein [Polyangiaceae bacterium]
MTRKHLPVASLCVAGALVLVSWSAYAVDRNFAGSAQLDYFFVPTSSGNINKGNTGPAAGGILSPGTAGEYGFDGLTLEANAKVAVDVSDHLSANLKVCYGCHGFELDMAYADYRVADELYVRAGRFSPSFGSFNLRHDVANHKLSDKPLPYDMGRMLRMRQWNLGVVPSPFPDNGLEIGGTHWFGDQTQVDYAAFAVQGFRSYDAHPTDLNFVLSRTPYYVDNNGVPTVGGRLSMTRKLGELSDLSIGASGMYGTYDTNNSLSYAIVGGDLSLRVVLTNVRFEYLVRRTEMDTTDPMLFASPPTSSNAVYRHGAYVEIEQPITSAFDLVARLDGLLREGRVVANPVGDEQLGTHSWILRYTLGATLAFERGFRLKLSTALWQFSDGDDDGHKIALGMHGAFVAAF